MGVGISNWRLARAVAQCGQLGVVSGTGLDNLLIRRLEDGDPGGHMREAMAAFPIQSAVDSLQRRLASRPHRPGGPYSVLPLYKLGSGASRQQASMLAAFVEVWLAKQGHGGQVGINLLTKIQPPTLPTLYGAMLAGVDYVLMGAGIPREIPAALERLALHEPAEVRLDVAGASSDKAYRVSFDPHEHWEHPSAPLRCPRFVPIVASTLLASVLVRKTTGRIDGLVIESPSAGGHSAAPRGELRLDANGEPIYGERDVVDLNKIRELGVPFWLAGGTGNPRALQAARASGAAGVQVGTLFAYCEESGMDDELKHSVLSYAARGEVRVRTDVRASPTGYPFKLVEWPDDPSAGKDRRRVCDIGYLREAYVTPAGTVGFRCAAEPVDVYVKKGGAREDTVGRRCLCNGLMATAGHPQRRRNEIEPPLLTSGDDLVRIGEFLAGRDRYRAADVVDYLLGTSAPAA
ncbi:MAG: nitronate monooxygenase [Burkholderiales bacterium]|nr:nitronate monooxygenase [Burkholderiales bacterium]